MTHKDIKPIGEVLIERKQLINQKNQLSKRFQELLVQQENLYKEKAIEKGTKKIYEAGNKYKNKKKINKKWNQKK